MPRVKRGTKRRSSRKKTLALAKGFFLTKSKLHRAAQEAVEKSLKYGYVGRKLKKRDFRSLWIVRIGAGARDYRYSPPHLIDLIGRLNTHHLEQRGPDAELEACIQTYELAFRMQSAAPEAVDLAAGRLERQGLFGLTDRHSLPLSLIWRICS